MRSWRAIRYRSLASMRCDAMSRYVISLIIIGLLGLEPAAYGQLSLGGIETVPCPLAFNTNTPSIAGLGTPPSTGTPPISPDTLLKPTPGTGFLSGTPLQFSPGGTGFTLGTSNSTSPSAGINGFNPGATISPSVTSGTTATTLGVIC